MEPIFRRQALRDGTSDEQLQAAVAKGERVRLRNGAYALACEFGELFAEDKHRIMVVASIPRLHKDSVVSHVSAAVLHGLPLWRTDIGRVYVTRPGSTTCETTRVKFIGQPLSSEEIVSIDGIRVTSLNRTLLDVVRTLPFEQAVVVGDAALRRGAQLPTNLDRRRGNEQARRTLEFLDGRSESVGESRSRVLIDRKSITKPLVQVTILDHSGGFIGRVDLCWPEYGLVGEFDGDDKYRSSDAPNVVGLEKAREGRLRDAGWNVVRWGWKDLDEPADMIRRLGKNLTSRVDAPSPWFQRL
ncbi:type IV toxin-antitoxin system AbiEi family antitoxin domain-containing protein [Smaragdicoccus niigatensis]|uniref:type IV toxin-antitoxin system AbiEi family antitoxin domain-containing protein n=1 Tax=Smaragdicoccus niigatensis TaxID=359359 RepID=UPI000371C7F6|nr:hypothetical protein [Smaragdicoccus niigatensis]